MQRQIEKNENSSGTASATQPSTSSEKTLNRNDQLCSGDCNRNNQRTDLVRYDNTIVQHQEHFDRQRLTL